MNAMSHILIGAVTLLAPLPREPMPDPLARGYLGIVVEDGTLMIKSVEPGTPAAKVGLRTGDVFTRVGHLQPDSFDQVVNQICSYRPGTLLEVEIRRGSETHVLMVRLAARPAHLGLPPVLRNQIQEEP